MRSMRFPFCAVLSIVVLFCTMAVAGDYRMITPDELKGRLQAPADLIIVDIQVEEEYARHHLPGSLATYAYPVKSEADRARLDQAVSRYQETGKEIVIVCPRGAGGAKRCYDYLKAQSIPEEKLAILDKGIAGWPYPGLLESL